MHNRSVTAPARHAIEVIGHRILGDDEPELWMAFAMQALDLEQQQVRASIGGLTPMLAQLIAHVLAGDAAARGVELRDAWRPEHPPTTITLQRSDGAVTVPGETISVWPDDTGRARFVVRLHELNEGTWQLRVMAAQRDFPDACRLKDELVERAHERDNPLRGCHLTATSQHDNVSLRAEPYPTASRHDLRLSDEVWDAVDRCVHRHLARVEQLRGLGFGQRRGLLFHGPPGTGKTHLGRVIASELAGKATTIVVDRQAMLDELTGVYEYAAWLAPSVVFLEDIDVIAARRGGPGASALQSVLNELDGPLTPDRPVVTIATTNDLAALDEAAVRSGRFDQIVEVPTPDLAGRRLILERYADALGEGAEIDAGRLALATHGASGADLRELFRRALLDTDGIVTTATLERLAREDGIGHDTGHGAYL